MKKNSKKKSISSLEKVNERLDLLFGPENVGRFLVTEGRGKLLEVTDQQNSNTFYATYKTIDEDVSEYLTRMNTDRVNIFGTREYCLRLCQKELYLFDMRCWKKPRKEITYADLMQWLERGCSPANCGHLTYTLTDAIVKRKVSVDEVIKAMLENKNVQMPEELGSAFEDGVDSFFQFVGYSKQLEAFMQNQKFPIYIL